MATLSCFATMTDVDGHRVFNPHLRGFLDWESRDSWQKPDEVLAALRLPEGTAVADVGAGSGYFTERFSLHLGPEGHVYATDVQELMITALEERVQQRELHNVTVVRAAFEDPSLPDACCDLAFFSSVYKEIDGRVDFMRRLAPTLRPGGRVAILEFRPSYRGFGPPSDERLPRDQVIEELEAAGFALAESFDFLPREYFLVFALVQP